MTHSLDIPKFLRRKRTKDSRANVDTILRQQTAKRSWAPIKKISEIVPRPSLPLMTDHPDLPVKVQVKGKEAGSTLLAVYANMAEFETKHNKATYPVRGQPIFFDNHNVILVTAKPWADKEKNAVKRVGPKASAVICNKVQYDSVLAAFQALKLPVSKHQAFRAQLKKDRTKVFLHDGTKYNFSYEIDKMKPVDPAAMIKPLKDIKPAKARKPGKPAEQKLMERLGRKKK